MASMDGRAFSSNMPLFRRNLIFPLLWEGRGYRGATLADRAEAALIHYAMTKRGSLWSDPNYGTLLYTIRGQGMTKTRTGDIRIGGSDAILDDVKTGIGAYVPAVSLSGIALDMEPGKKLLRCNFIWTLNPILLSVPQVGKPKKTQVTI